MTFCNTYHPSEFSSIFHRTCDVIQISKSQNVNFGLDSAISIFFFMMESRRHNPSKKILKPLIMTIINRHQCQLSLVLIFNKRTKRPLELTTQQQKPLVQSGTYETGD